MWQFGLTTRCTLEKVLHDLHNVCREMHWTWTSTVSWVLEDNRKTRSYSELQSVGLKMKIQCTYMLRCTTCACADEQKEQKTARNWTKTKNVEQKNNIISLASFRHFSTSALRAHLLQQRLTRHGRLSCGTRLRRSEWSGEIGGEQ